MAMKHFMGYLENLPAAEVKKILDLKAQEMKNAVTGAPSYQPKNERVLYVANAGDDNNSGLCPCKPIRTIAKAAELMQPGDTILFKRGDHFRGNITVKEGVTLSAYGEGIKPIINSSRKNFADPALWEKTDKENVWHLTEKANNVGLIHFDPSYTYGVYNEKYGTMRIKGRDFDGYADLKADLEYYSDYHTQDLYLYSAENPGERFLDIELGERLNTIGIGGSNVTIDNLWIMHTGAHGVGSGTTKNLTVTNCVFSWLGGSILTLDFYGSGPVRYGNAVEIYGGCDGYRVENNWMYQIYDTAVTHQFSGGEVDCTQNNVLYKNNLMEFCFWFIEYYDAPTGDWKRFVHNVYMTGNFCRFGGYGWGCKGREHATPMFCGSSMCNDVENFIAENNIFYQSLGRLVVLANCEGHHKEIIRNNLYVQPEGAVCADVFDKHIVFEEAAKDLLKEAIHEDEPTFVYMPRPGYNF